MELIPPMSALKLFLGGILALTLGTAAAARPAPTDDIRPAARGSDPAPIMQFSSSSVTNLIEAQPLRRPVARSDAALARAEAARIALATYRPSERPPHMVRYPAVVIAGAVASRCCPSAVSCSSSVLKTSSFLR